MVSLNYIIFILGMSNDKSQGLLIATHSTKIIFSLSLDETINNKNTFSLNLKHHVANA